MTAAVLMSTLLVSHLNPFGQWYQVYLIKRDCSSVNVNTIGKSPLPCQELPKPIMTAAVPCLNLFVARLNPISKSCWQSLSHDYAISAAAHWQNRHSFNCDCALLMSIQPMGAAVMKGRT